MNTGDWTTVIGTALAATAAGASWRSVRLNSRQWRLSQEPLLSSQLQRTPSGEIKLIVLNAGAGPARGIRFCVVAGETFAAGYAGAQFGGYLPPGERVAITVDLRPVDNEEATGLAVCWDSIGRVHRFTLHGEHEVSRRQRNGREERTEPKAAYLEKYGAGALERLTQVGGRG